MAWKMYDVDFAEEHATEGSNIFFDNEDVKAVVVMEDLPVHVQVIGFGQNLAGVWGVFVAASKAFYSFGDEDLLTILVKE